MSENREENRSLQLEDLILKKKTTLAVISTRLFGRM
jgi:hypothetical protein